MQWAAHPHDDRHPELDLVAEMLDPVLAPLGFTPGQAGAGDGSGQVIFCHGELRGPDDGCVDLVVDLEATPDWRIVDVRYWGFPSERWHLAFDRQGDLHRQLAELATTLPSQLS